jgi:hypothetical protein
VDARASTRLTPAEGRRFAFVVGGVFLLLSALAWRGGHPLAAALTGAPGTLLVVAGLVAPARLAPVQRAWMTFGRALSKVTAPVVMAVFYYVALTPTALLRRRFGGNPLREHRRAETVWTARPAGRRRSNLERPF